MFTHQIKKLFCTMILVLVGCSYPATAIPVPLQPTPAPVKPTIETIPVFEEAECAFEIPEGFQPRCGYLIVPEDRSQPDGRTIRLHVAIFKSTNANPARDPVIHLIGGPGGSALNNAKWILMGGGTEILEQRGYILFDQRGTQYSDPYLYCLPYDEYLWDAHEQNISLAEYNAGALPILGACLEDWRSQGINIAAYNSAESAADMNDLRLALGYEQVNLYGISYGTRLALNIMRDYPEGTITIDPLPNFRVVKDMVIDIEPFFEKYRAVKPFLIAKETDSPAEFLQSMEERKEFDEAIRCILCACCTAACPISSENENYLGPAALLRAFRYLFDSRDQDAEERLGKDHQHILDRSTAGFNRRA